MSAYNRIRDAIILHRDYKDVITYKWFELEYETIEVAVDEVLLAQIKEIITPLGWTVERLIVRFLEWLVDPETQEEAIAWLMKAKEELGEK